MESTNYHNKNYGLFCTTCIVVMMWADKKVSSEEIGNALKQAKENPEFDQKDLQAINHLYEKFPEIVEKILVVAAEALPANDKRMGIKMGFDMANSDGDLSAKEKNKLKEIIGMAGLSDEDYEKILKEI
jgi:tellurite resistance protein